MQRLLERAYRRYAERADAREVVSALNRVWVIVVPVIHQHGGGVDKFVGDGLLAMFGAPRRQEDHARRALTATRKIAGRAEGSSQASYRSGSGSTPGEWWRGTSAAAAGLSSA